MRLKTFSDFLQPSSRLSADTLLDHAGLNALNEAFSPNVAKATAAGILLKLSTLKGNIERDRTAESPENLSRREAGRTRWKTALVFGAKASRKSLGQM